MKTRYGSRSPTTSCTRGRTGLRPARTDWHSEFIHGEENMGGLVDLLPDGKHPCQMIHITDVLCESRSADTGHHGLRILAARPPPESRPVCRARRRCRHLWRVTGPRRASLCDPEFAEWSGIRRMRCPGTSPRVVRTVTAVRFEGEDYQFHSKVRTYRTGGGCRTVCVGGGNRNLAAKCDAAKARYASSVRFRACSWKLPDVRTKAV